MSSSSSSSPRHGGLRTFPPSSRGHTHTHSVKIQSTASSVGQEPSPPFWTTHLERGYPPQSYSHNRSLPGRENFDYNKYSPVSIAERKYERNSCSSCGHIIAPLPTPPYETPVSIPAGPRSAPVPQSTHHQVPSYPRSQSNAGFPPSPPWGSQDMSAGVASSPRQRASSTFSQPVSTPTAMPGTMQSGGTQTDVVQPESPRDVHGKTATNSDAKSIDKDGSDFNPKSKKSNSVGFGSRFKSALKDMFKREPIDESKFERIEARHWAE